jgi:non-ribosomal peptide synthetase component F
MLFPDRMQPCLPPAAGGGVEGGETEYAGLRISYLEVPQQEGQFDLAVELRHSSSSLTGVFRYRTDLFEPATIERLVERFRRTLDIAMAEPETRVADLSLVDRAELDQVLALGRG